MADTNNRDRQLINELADNLDRLEETQNKINISEFTIYKDLFIKSTIERLERSEIQRLSTSFARRFNMYKPIEVYGDDSKLMFKVPQLFVPIKDVENRYTSAVDKFNSEGVSDVPRYAAEATKGLLEAILKSQNDVSDFGYGSYNEYIRSLSDEYAQTTRAFNKAMNNNTAGDKPGNTESSKDDMEIGGIEWT